MVNSPFTIHHSLLLKMKILIVCSKNSGNIAPFIVEQVDSLIKAGFLMDYFTIESKCWKGYLKSRKSLLSKIKEFKPDLIHAHYGLSGLLANLQRRVPVVTTYHGSDINDRRVYPFSRLCMMVSKQNIFVSKNIAFKSLKRDLKNRKNYSLIPCGVDINLFVPMDKESEFTTFATEKSITYTKGTEVKPGFVTLNAPAATLQKLDQTVLDELQTKLQELGGAHNKSIETAKETKVGAAPNYEEQKRKIRKRAAWLAERYARQRTRESRLLCDDCGFDPQSRTLGTGVKPRSILDVHHKNPLDEGVRVTTLSDFCLLCPNCHRFAHALARSSAVSIRAG